MFGELESAQKQVNLRRLRCFPPFVALLLSLVHSEMACSPAVTFGAPVLLDSIDLF